MENKLYEGQVIKNYKVLCSLLGWEVSFGNTKISQLKELERYYLYHKEGQKYIIDNIFNIPKDKIDNRINNGGNHNQGKFKEYKNLNISKEKWNNIGIYYILKNNDIYIGSTIVGFRERFQEHYWGYDENMKHTYDLLHTGGTFNILHNMTAIEDEVLIRQVEDEYLQYFTSNTDYNVINKKENAWSLIEKKEKYKTLKIKESKYEQVIQLLIDNGLLDLEEDATPTNNYNLNGIINNNIKNVSF